MLMELDCAHAGWSVQAYMVCQTLSVSIFLLTFPWQTWTAAPPSLHSPPFIIPD